MALQERWAGARVYCADGVEDVLAETGDLTAEDIFSPHQFIHYSGSWSASTLIELDPLNDRIHVKHIDSREGKEGNILFDDFI